MVIVLSAFNGIERMIELLYSDFDPPLTIRSSQTKTFFKEQIDFQKLNAVKGIKNYSIACEELVILKHEDKWSNATMLGVAPSFLSISRIDSHIIDGIPALYENNTPMGIIGATLLDNLGGYIPQKYGNETIIVYAPKRNINMRMGKNPFQTQIVPISARINYNKEVNANNIIVPIEFAQELLGYADNELNAIYVDIEKDNDKKKIKNELQQLVGTQFSVKTNDEKNELIFKTAKTERLLVIVILGFIFLLASFNLVASLNMLMIEKKEDINVLTKIGGNRKFIFQIFFYEGLLISIRGICWGLFIGYVICWVQLQFSIITMPNSYGAAFPIALKVSDFFIIVLLLGTLSVIASYLPVKIFTSLINKVV